LEIAPVEGRAAPVLGRAVPPAGAYVEIDDRDAVEGRLLA
jgi:hypothetical protein